MSSDLSSDLNSQYSTCSLSSSTDIVAIPSTSVIPTMGISEGSTMHGILTLASRESGEHWEPARGQNFRHATIEMLPENTLLEIFDFYRLDTTKHKPRFDLPWKWQPLAHVCRKWRHVLSMSPHRLGLQIYCKTGRPIEPILDSWSTLPLVIRVDHGRSKSSRPHRNIIIALRHSDRVCDIDLAMPISMIETIVDALQGSFPKLERIRMTSRFEETGPPVLTKFLGGSAPRLKEIFLDGVAIPPPALRQLLSSTINLVKLRLWKITSAGYFSTDTLVIILSHPTLARLESLAIHFHLSASRPTSNRARPPPPERATLPSLTSLDFHGSSDYLEGFVSKIDTPALKYIGIAFYNQLIFEVQELSQFIIRADRLHPFVRASVYLYETSVHIEFYLNGSWACHFKIQRTGFDWQLSFIAEILGHLSPSLSSVDVLDIRASVEKELEDVDSTQFLELFRPFTHVSTIQVPYQLVSGVAHALATEDTAAGVLPRLTSLTLWGYRYRSSSVAEAAKKFVAMRKLSGQKISLLSGR